jgi:hypothetical protein
MSNERQRYLRCRLRLISSLSLRMSSRVLRENASGHKVVKEDGRVSFYDGYQLIDAIWIEDEDGQHVPIP